MGQGGSQSEADVGDLLILSLLVSATGERSDVPLRYVEFDGRYYVLGSPSPPPRWLSAVPGRTASIWTIADRTFSGTADAVDDRRLLEGEIIPRFVAKYGAEQFRTWFGRGYLGLALNPEASHDGSLYGRVEALFDSLSADYDRTVLANPFDRYLRDVSIRVHLTAFRPGERLLEIGCGTGLETIPLAQSGVEVVAIDVSGQMLKTLQQKAAAAGVEDRIVVRKLRAADLGRILDEFGPGYFDGVFSDFGAMNTEPRWRETPPLLYRLIKPGGRLVLGVWNRVCLFEMAVYALRLNPMRALARLRSPVPVGLSRFGLPVLAHAPGEFERPFSRYFVREHVRGLPVVLPPYDLGKRISNPDAWVRLLGPLDRFLQPLAPFNRLGDHFLMIFRRRKDSRPNE